MDILWGSEHKKKFATNVGLITTTGPRGDNIMAAEWTHHVSFSPGLIAVCIGPGKATAINIDATQEFGVNLAASDQNVLSSVAGGETKGKAVNKIGVLKDLGFKFFQGKKIRAKMVEDAIMQAECKLVNKIVLGDHIMYVGEVVELYPVSSKDPLIYTENKYFKLGENIKKPAPEELAKIESIIAKHSKDHI
ncbi:MAG: flavin reductase family protein [Nanoarchaeota archaeon]|nr:flavin reductase family protein [Nanoarchaeota archaeon]